MRLIKKIYLLKTRSITTWLPQHPKRQYFKFHLNNNPCSISNNISYRGFPINKFIRSPTSYTLHSFSNAPSTRPQHTILIDNFSTILRAPKAITSP